MYVYVIASLQAVIAERVGYESATAWRRDRVIFTHQLFKRIQKSNVVVDFRLDFGDDVQAGSLFAECENRR
jgi:hypothetical protein